MEKIKTFDCYQFATTKVTASSSQPIDCPKDLTSEVPFLRLFSSIRIRNKEDLNLASYVKCGTIEIKGYHQMWHAWCGDLVTLSSTTDANLDWVFCKNILVFIGPWGGGGLTPLGTPDKVTSTVAFRITNCVLLDTTHVMFLYVSWIQYITSGPIHDITFPFEIDFKIKEELPKVVLLGAMCKVII